MEGPANYSGYDEENKNSRCGRTQVDEFHSRQNGRSGLADA
jgi:hypothetical protein